MSVPKLVNQVSKLKRKNVMYRRWLETLLHAYRFGLSIPKDKIWAEIRAKTPGLYDGRKNVRWIEGYVNNLRKVLEK